MSVSISMRSYLSISHLSAASLFAKQCSELEKSIDPLKIDPDLRREHNACAISSIILSAAFLEAVINEIFSDCAEDYVTERISQLPAKDLMARLWKLGIPRTASYPILEKYEIALELNNKEPVPQGFSPYQDAKLLIELRNALIHFEPETITSHSSSEERKVHKFEKRLLGKFQENRLVSLGNPFYPDKVLGAGGASWAVSSAVNFADIFFKNIGILPTYEHVRSTFL